MVSLLLRREHPDESNQMQQFSFKHLKGHRLLCHLLQESSETHRLICPQRPLVKLAHLPSVIFLCSSCCMCHDVFGRQSVILEGAESTGSLGE